MGKDTKIGLLVGVLVVILFALVFFGGGSGTEEGSDSDGMIQEAALGTANQEPALVPARTVPRAAGTPGAASGSTPEADSSAASSGGSAGEVVVSREFGTDESAVGSAGSAGGTAGVAAGTGVSTGGEETVTARPAAAGLLSGRIRTAGLETPTPVSGAAGEVYVVQPGDCYYTIAKVKYGKASLWPVIRDANQGKDLYPGMKIVIPPRPAERRLSAAASPPAPETVGPNEYLVKPNDSLWKIAAEKLGDGTLYLLIFEANRDRLRSPDQALQVGMRLRLPSRDAVRSRGASRGVPASGGGSAPVRTARGGGSGGSGAGRSGGRPADID